MSNWCGLGPVQMSFHKGTQPFHIGGETTSIDLERVRDVLTASMFSDFDRQAIKTWKAVKRPRRKFEEVHWQSAIGSKGGIVNRIPADEFPHDVQR